VSSDDITIAAAAEGSSARRVDSSWPAVALGEHVDRFEVLRSLGGAMGAVFLAFDPQLDRKVVVKLLRHRAEMTPARRAELLLEARAVAQLSHPNVVEVLGVGEHDGTIYLAMEFVPGPTLEDWLKPGRDTSEILDVFIQAGRGLAAAHAAGLVHRDFKPSNVIVGRGLHLSKHRARILDFGLVVDLGQNAPTTELVDPKRRRIAGTPRYMAPEQYDGLQVTPQTDQFSFCVALFEALQGKHPFGEGDLCERARRVVDGIVARPARGPGVSRAVTRVVMRGLHAAWQDRWPSMESLLDALEQARRPARVRSVLVGGIGASLLLGSVAVAVPPEQDDACATGRRMMRAVWNEQRRAAMSDAFAATGLPSATELSAQTETGIEQYVETWSHAYADTCEALGASASEGLEPDGRMLCLREEIGHLDRLVSTLEHADAAALLRAPTVAGSLALPRECTDSAQSEFGDTPRVRSLWSRVRTAEAQRKLGRFEQARDLLNAALREARNDPDARKALARALLASAVLAADELEPERCLAQAEEAYFEGLETGDDRTAADAASKLVRHGAFRGHEYVDLWSRRAHAAFDRLDEHPRQVAVLHYDRGSAAIELRDYERAKLELELAAEGFSELEPPAPLATAAALSELGRIHLAQHDDEAALARYEEAYRLKREAVGSTHPTLITVLNNQSILLLRLERNERALDKITEAVTIAESTWGRDSVMVARPLMTYSSIVEQLGQLDESETILLRLVDLYEAQRTPNHADLFVVHARLAILYREMKRLEAAVSHSRRAIAIEQNNPVSDHSGTIGVHTRLGQMLAELGELTEARYHLEEATHVAASTVGTDAEEYTEAVTALAAFDEEH
jgi:tetratricopeptide (TPR) repeat protein